MPWELPLVAAGEAAGELHAGQDGAVIRRSVLPGGVRVLTEHVPGIRSATVGLWVSVGSRDEVDGHYGSTHFLEHLLFKGTKTRTAQQIAETFDGVGGEVNATTGKESTCYYARVLDTDVPMAVQTLTDMLTSSLIAPAEFEVERQVILEELAMADDDPSDVLHERFAALALHGTELARPIGGTPETIKAVPRDAVWEHYQQHYRTDTLVVTAAGGVDHDQICREVIAGLERGNWQTDGSVAPAPRRATAPSSISLDADGAAEATISRQVEQMQLLIGCKSISVVDSRRFTMSVLNAVLGGGMSSRLFQEIREKRGLVYTTYSFSSQSSDAGIFAMYAGCSPQHAEEVESLMINELERLAQFGVGETELARCIGQLTGSLVLGLEDMGSRMSRLALAELTLGKLLSIEESLESLRAVTADEVQALARELVAAPRRTVYLKPEAV